MVPDRGEGQPGVLIKGIQKVHGRFFKKNNTVFMWRDAALEEEELYANKFKELMQIGGHYIFYEKNPSMQNYMINMRKKIGVTPSEVVEDRAAKDFRSAVKEKKGIQGAQAECQVCICGQRGSRACSACDRCLNH